MNEYDDNPPASLEVALEDIRRNAELLPDLQLDERIASMNARRNVYAAHGNARSADLAQSILEVLVDVRSMRHESARELEAMVSPVQILRPLTAEELAESTWPDDEPDSPC